MDWKHATATFWRTPASELIVISAGDSDAKCLVDWASSDESRPL